MVLYLGLDCSTQSLKASAVSETEDGRLRVDHTFAVNYDRDMPEFGTSGGMHLSEGGARVTSPALMWVRALDLLLERMQAAGFPFGEVRAVSGSGQQHGSVYWAQGAGDLLARLDPSKSLGEQLAGAFAREASPIWADSSTSRQCARLEQAVGGPQALAKATGSRAYERYTGNQIARILEEEPEVYARCERISLVSSFMCSVLLGHYAPIDTSDGSGMNLADLLADAGTCWHPGALAACAPEGGAAGLKGRLGDRLTQAHEALGPVSSYFRDRFGFSEECVAVAWSGDNPCSLAGLGLRQAGDVAVSLGTSDTMFAVMADARPGVDGHVLRNPVDPATFMGMLVFKNGALVREAVRDRCCGGDWEKFSRALAATAPGNNGRLGFFFESPEITPTTAGKSGTRRFGPDGDAAAAFDDAAEVRAVVEGRFLAMRHFAGAIGVDLSSVRRVVATGGASANPAILQVLADVFGAPVHTLEAADSAPLGAALRARHGLLCRLAGGFTPFDEALEGAAAERPAAQPSAGAKEAYGLELMARFAALQQKVVQELLAGA